jgi:tetratricopeptide (TPR) repeat protein
MAARCDRMAAAAFAAAIAFCVAPAQGAVQVLGNGIAHSCYKVAEANLEPRHGVVLCTDALLHGTLSQRDRTATLVNRAILRSRAGDLTGAMADYDTALEIGANDGEVYLNRSATLIALKRYADALHDADAAVNAGVPRMEIAYYNRGLANEALGNIKAAYDDLAAALKVAPDFAAAKDALARFRVVRTD